MARKGYEKVSQREYARRLGISNEAVSKAIREHRIVKGWNKKEQKIIIEHADKEFGFVWKETNVSEKPEYKTKASSGTLSADANCSFSEARRKREIVKLNLDGLELMKVKGQLVNKEIVYKQLFTFGQNIRSSFLAIPDRTIDNILASKTRAEAHNLLTTALHEVLEALTKIDNLNFQ